MSREQYTKVSTQELVSLGQQRAQERAARIAQQQQQQQQQQQANEDGALDNENGEQHLVADAADFPAAFSSPASASSSSSSAAHLHRPPSPSYSSTDSSNESSALVPHASHEDSADAETGDSSSSSNSGTVADTADNGSTSSGSGSGGPAGLIVLDKGAPMPGEITVTLMRLGGTGIGNIQLNVPLEWRVGQLTARVFAREIREEHARIRVIFMGRMLRDEEFLGTTGVANGCILHTHIMPGTAPAPSAPFAEGGGGDIEQGGAGGQQGEVLIDDENAAAIASAEGVYPGNYTPAQLQLMRVAQMQQAQQQQREEMQMIGRQREGTACEFFIGFLLGFVLGFLSIIWLYSPSLSRKQRLGILLGLTANFVSTLLNFMDPQPTTTEDSSAAPAPEPVTGGVSNG